MYLLIKSIELFVFTGEILVTIHLIICTLQLGCVVDVRALKSKEGILSDKQFLFDFLKVSVVEK